jgi:hypothetical protein
MEKKEHRKVDIVGLPLDALMNLYFHAKEGCVMQPIFFSILAFSILPFPSLPFLTLIPPHHHTPCLKSNSESFLPGWRLCPHPQTLLRPGWIPDLTLPYPTRYSHLCWFPSCILQAYHKWTRDPKITTLSGHLTRWYRGWHPNGRIPTDNSPYDSKTPFRTANYNLVGRTPIWH